MPDLILNSFPVEVSPTEFSLPYVEYPSWEASTDDMHRRFAEFRIHRHPFRNPTQGVSEPPLAIRLILLSGPQAPNNNLRIDCRTADSPSLTNKLIEHSLAQHLSKRDMTIKYGKFETSALRFQHSSQRDPISFYTGISFRSRRPHSDEPLNFALTVQWTAGARFSRSLKEETLKSISLGLPVLYTPTNTPPDELSPFTDRFLGTVESTTDPATALISCKDNVRRSIPLDDLTLEPSAEALRRYELRVGTDHYRDHVRKRVQRLSKVLTENSRRNTSVLRDRLDAIIQTLSGTARDQLVLPLCSFVKGTVRIRLSPQHVRFEP